MCCASSALRSARKKILKAALERFSEGFRDFTVQGLGSIRRGRESLGAGVPRRARKSTPSLLYKSVVVPGSC